MSDYVLMYATNPSDNKVQAWEFEDAQLESRDYECGEIPNVTLTGVGAYRVTIADSTQEATLAVLANLSERALEAERRVVQLEGRPDEGAVRDREAAAFRRGVEAALPSPAIENPYVEPGDTPW